MPVIPASRNSRARPSDRVAEPRPRRIVALYECGRSGPAALAQAAALFTDSAFELTVVALAPQDTDPSCCSAYVEAYNRGVRADAAAELREAKRLLGRHRDRARFELLVEGTDPPLEAWVAAGGVDLVLLPARRALSRSPHHPLERRLRQSTDAEVRVVSAAGRRERRAA
jgi:hypothetical protein